MSKQIAQTVGDKRVAVLIALLAAFAVLAMFATQWQDSNAEVDIGNFCYDERDTAVTPITPECADFIFVPNPVGLGQTIPFKMSIETLSVGTLGDLVLQMTLDPDLGNIGNIVNNTGNNTACVVSNSGGTNNRITCTIQGPLAPGALGTVIFTASVIGSGDIDDALNIMTANDVGSAQGAQTIPDNFTDDIVVIAPLDNTLTKTDEFVGSGGGNVVQVISVSNTEQVDVNGSSITITDLVPAGVTVNSVTATSGNVAGTLLAAPNCGLPGPTPGPFALVCTVNFTAAQFNQNDSIQLNLNLTVAANTPPLLEPDVRTDTASVILSFGAPPVSFTDTQDADITVFAEVPEGEFNPGLVHLTQPLPDGEPESVRDHNNDVIGFRHTICMIDGIVDAVWPNVLPDTDVVGNNFRVTTISGTATFEAPVVTAGVDCDGDGVTTPEGLTDDSTLSWYSTSPGEQDIVVVNDAGSTVFGWNETTDEDSIPLVKEWDTLAPTQIRPSVAGGECANTSVIVNDAIVGTNLDGTTVTRPTVFNPATGVYQGDTANFCEFPIATHTNAAGTHVFVAYGAQVTFTRAGTSTCGAIDIDDEPSDVLDFTGDNFLDEDGDEGVAISRGVGISFHFHAHEGVNPCTGINGSTTVLIQVDYPTLLGSDNPPAPALERLTVNWTGTVAAKQVFLAWAGQRVILEHDWRLPAGDIDGGTGSTSPDNLGECIFGDEQRFDGVEVTYIKNAGTGSFLPGDGVSLNGSDHARVLMSSDASQTDGEDIVGDMNGMCISRVLFEDQGNSQNDVELFADNNPATKVAFVIYYMKINTINVSLVTQVSKPSHNSSTIADYAPGNPWNATLDDADNAADWNVSKDLLVRGRVTGWFLNENPSGRAADTSNPLNVLPANRWVMPNDWPLLAGGPADPADGTDAIGTAEQFRPYYDLMFAPNNTRGITLGNPSGTNVTQAAVVVTVTGVTNTATVFRVTTCNDLAAYQAAGGTSILVGATTVSIVSCVGTTLTVSAVLAAAPAAGTPVFIPSGAPFEGPYSTIDIVGLASQGLGGAALSDFDPNNIRDAALDDGDVDWWDAPMPVAPVSVAIRGTGFIKQVIKSDVYYIGTPNLLPQVYPNPYYIVDIPASPFISAQAAGGGGFWDTWGNDGPGGNGQGVYNFWQAAITGTNSAGIGDSFTTAQTTELAAIRTAYGDNTIARDLVVYSDNHGEFMVTANGDYRTDLTACATNVLAGGKHCKPGDKVGTGSIEATVDYPEFRGKHFPVRSNIATVSWTWGGYKDVTVEAGETDQFKYIVFHALDRDAFCSPLATGAVLLHPVLSSEDEKNSIGVPDPVETVDFLIDSGEGIIIDSSSGAGTPPINDGKQFATGLRTFSTALNDPAVTGIKEFPHSGLAPAVNVDECQAWIKVSNSLLGIINILAIAHDDEGNIGFDEIIDLTNTTSYTLTFRWSLITWAGADAIPVTDAIKGTGTSGKNPGGNDISASVTAIYGWEAASQSWLGYFPTGVNVPGANDLNTLETGEAYWIAITGPSSVTWTIASNVN